ncbi:MAG: biogenesis protein MshI [Pseudomonadota bacterium]|nr:biogenesis protein MshI [Pseudomonadota bacterium]
MTPSSLLSSIVAHFRRRSSVPCVQLEVRPDGLAWAVSSGQHGQTAGFAECSPARRESTLSALVAENGWAGAKTTIVLPMDQYQVFQVERPEGVNDEELSDALKWKLKDFLDYSPSDAVSDVFECPEDATRGRGRLVNVVAVRKSLARELVEMVSGVGLAIERIDIAELALRQFAAGLDRGGHGVAVVHLRERYGQLVICRGEMLYLSRRLDLSDDELRDAATQDAAVQSLALEIQRSLDYYESQLGQSPPSTLHLLSRDSVLPLPSMLSTYLATRVVTPEWSEHGFQDEPDSRCLPAWCAGLTLPGGGE